MVGKLDLQAVVGFKGSVPDGLLLHPDNSHLIYPLGSTVVVRHVPTREQTFLRGHDAPVNALALSKSGQLLASGAKTHMGFPADVIVWDFEKREAKFKLRLHKVAVQCLTFSPSERFLASLGGQDDNALVVWDLETGTPICGTPAATDSARTVTFFRTSDRHLVSAGRFHIRIWTFDLPNKKLRPLECRIGNLQRVTTSAVTDATDSNLVCGTTTGDILYVQINSSPSDDPELPFRVDSAVFRRAGPSATQNSELFPSQTQKKTLGVTSVCRTQGLFSQGITCLQILDRDGEGIGSSGDVLVGTGAGVIARVAAGRLRVMTEAAVLGAVTSVQVTADGMHAFVGTDRSNIYWVDLRSMTVELRNTCHYGAINQVVFPFGCSDVFATCSQDDVRVWNARTRQELLRISVPNLECLAIDFVRDGKSILSGWSDGKVRAFLPQSGRLLYTIHDAHKNGCTALATSSDCTTVISGGMDGEIRVWKVSKLTQVMEASMKEHRGRVWSLKIRQTLPQVVSASSDGSVIVWDLTSYTRVMCLFESTMFKALAFHPDESQLLTTGSDRRVSYWDTFDGQQIRVLETGGSHGGDEDGEAVEGEMNCLAVTRTGSHFVIGGETKRVQIWDYDMGVCKYEGVGHSAGVNFVSVSPDQSTVVSVGKEGAVMIWRTPDDVFSAATAEEEEILPQ
uniref:Cilia- and flagella-associated protein 52 n=1 Tax=Chromera velia CCMP2878 TaxID=1169474 RepID=A0A0G4HQM4_9ALVE|eukprot:Cvel_8006.t1-p1 / transcript=Cvel_8006.t1 / gene=Cvel_8006 / organism=Chromera_velia_CCMP2878 / gene_product=WD repeat-containing protein 16, putative / transcript_product=WD repeat-containing protein 16, putative / location=Cvel_scaffold431:64530-74429(-) / protein_length=680 / sequence_SO=supercontig / SO=protein_coding / is_pseudo=false